MLPVHRMLLDRLTDPQVDFVYMCAPPSPCYQLSRVSGIFDEGCLQQLSTYCCWTGCYFTFPKDKFMISSSFRYYQGFCGPYESRTAWKLREISRSAPFLNSLPCLLHCQAQLVLDNKNASLSRVSSTLGFSAK